MPVTIETLRNLDKAERKAWRVMMKGPEADAVTLPSAPGKNYVAWCAAADACRETRKALGLLGKRGY